MGKIAKTADKVRNFSSLAEFDATTSKEGDLTTQVFDEVHEIRRIIHKGEAKYSVVDVVAALSETTSQDHGAYWRKLKQRLRAEGGK